MQVIKATLYRLHPTPEQENYLLRMAGACRFVWNWGLTLRQKAWKEKQDSLHYQELSRRLTLLKQQPETAFLQEVDARALQQSLIDLEAAFVNFFAKRARYPRFKRKRESLPSFRIPVPVQIEQGKVRLPKIGWINLKISPKRLIEGTILNATIKQENYGAWRIAICYKTEAPDPPIPPQQIPDEKVVGVDVGLCAFVTTDQAEKTDPPRFYRRAERKLKQAHRTLSRKQKGSKNRHKAKKRLAAIYRKIQHKRQQFLAHLVKHLSDNYDLVCIEDLNVRGLVKTKQAKSWYDAAHSIFLRMLLTKMTWKGKWVVKVGRFFPSSKRCHQCGYIHEALKLSDRSWICPTCGLLLDRDVNAALNLKREGIRIVTGCCPETLTACGAGVRLLSEKQSARKQEVIKKRAFRTIAGRTSF